ncbi:MAG: hypothetical protein HFE63_04040 [Clostridiales bacterium]|nr:hypothetical protein [Clostridiales bacterium]
MEIITIFCGGNAEILEISENRVRFKPELRDTEGDWFYWAFEVTGAAGKTITFDMSPKNYVGYFGAAVSHDLNEWHWSNTALPDRTGFTYTFGADENRVYFAHNMLYHPSRFYKFAELRRLPVNIITTDNKGTPIPSVTVGSGERNIILTARHHACEATGDYVMEGIIDEFLKSPMDGFRITAIPFIDADGVVNGDQGKNRTPHDHNRDYLDEPLYNGVRAVQTLLAKGDVAAVFDLHSPWHIGGRNDTQFIVRKTFESRDEMIKFGHLFELETTTEAMNYKLENDIDPNVDWNKVLTTATTCGTYAGTYESVKLGFTLETTYFGEVGNVVSQDKIIESGRCFYRAVKRYFEENNK